MLSLAQTISQYSHTCILLLTYKCFWDTKDFMHENYFYKSNYREEGVLLFCFDWSCLSPKSVSPTSPPNTGRKAISFTFPYCVHPFQESLLILRKSSPPLMGWLPWLSIFSSGFLLMPFGSFLLRIAYFDQSLVPPTLPIPTTTTHTHLFC